jgi:hypothetical protein
VQLDDPQSLHQIVYTEELWGVKLKGPDASQDELLREAVPDYTIRRFQEAEQQLRQASRAHDTLEENGATFAGALVRGSLDLSKSIDGLNSRPQRSTKVGLQSLRS